MEWNATSSSRLDAFLAAETGSSRAKVQKAIKSGSVTVNAAVVSKPAHILSEGDHVVLEDAIPEDPSTDVQPADLSIDVLNEDDACLVLNKPAGIAVHPAPGEKDSHTLLHGIAHLFAERSLPFSADAVLVHRLDKETTGCLLVAKNADAHTFFQKQFEDRTVQKTYLAIVASVPQESSALIDAPIGRNLTDRTKMSVLKTSTSRDAQTKYDVLDSTDDSALLSCDLLTGRTHQIRVHLASIGHPILGDPTYCSDASRNTTSEYQVSSLCLHSHKLSFTTKEKGECSVEAPLPEQFLAALGSTGLHL